MAGYFAKNEQVALTIVPLEESEQDKLPFAFSISLAVRKSDELLRQRLNAALVRKRDTIRILLDEYQVPLTDSLQKSLPFTVEN
ncbi:MAG: hypothetical protein PHG36_07905 [Dehalococcoidia bacterium]|nr:hypothetical protein [Dehalococcoidia bacterium]